MEDTTIVLDLDIENIEKNLMAVEEALNQMVNLFLDVGNKALVAMQSVNSILNKTTIIICKMSTNIESAIVKLNELITMQNGENSFSSSLSAGSDVCTILQTLITLTNEHIAAKMLSKAEDIAIIALQCTL